MDIIQLAILYAFLGGAIKFIDQAYDENAFSIRTANILAVLSGILMGYLMAVDSPFSTAFFAAMLISLALARKIDNLAFALGTTLAIVSMLVFSTSFNVSWELLAIFVFLVAGFVDEKVDDLVHAHNIEGPVQRFLNYRPFSDFALLGLLILGVFPIWYILPYFSFTWSYMFVEMYTVREYSISGGIDRFRSLVRLNRHT